MLHLSLHSQSALPQKRWADRRWPRSSFIQDSVLLKLYFLIFWSSEQELFNLGQTTPKLHRPDFCFFVYFCFILFLDHLYLLLRRKETEYWLDAGFSNFSRCWFTLLFNANKTLQNFQVNLKWSEAELSPCVDATVIIRVLPVSNFGNPWFFSFWWMI